MRTTVNLFACLAILCAAGCANPRTPQDLSGSAGWRGTAPNSPEAFRFVVMGDRTGGHEEGAWERAVAEVNRLKPDFVLCVGDLVEGYKEDQAVLRGQWDEFETLTSRLDAPFFYCGGNHDVSGTLPREVYTRRHGVQGRTYYSFNYRSCHFVILDSEAIVNDNRTVAPAQWAWLEKDLAAARNAAHVFILFHHPLYTESLSNWARLRALLDPARTTIFNGHYHRLSYDVEEGIPYYLLSSTATKVKNDRETGEFQSFAHVVVDRGRPTVSIIPVGQVLPHNVRDRHLADILSDMDAKSQVCPVTATGTEAVLKLAGPEEGQATATLTWTAEQGWFDGDVPAPETVSLAAGATVTRTYHIKAAKPQTQAPVLDVAYDLKQAGSTAKRAAKLTLPVIATLEAGRVSAIRVDGDLADWSSVPAMTTDTRARVTYGAQSWSGPEDLALKTRLGFDDRKFYLALEVSDDELAAKSGSAWEQDGVEIFWDTRPDSQRAAPFQGACRQIIIPVPQTVGKPELMIQPANSIQPEALDVVCVRRPGGYVIEVAVPFDSIAQGWRPSANTPLYFEAIVNDKDTSGDKPGMSNLVLSGEDNASRRTVGYARVTFRP